jgi:hypothetical protein
MSLKSYLSALLASYRSTHKSIPQTTAINFTETLTNGEMDYSYTAPSDGIFACQLGATANHLTILRNGSSAFSVSGTTNWAGCSLLVKAGDKILPWYASSDKTSATIYICFYPSVGE